MSANIYVKRLGTNEVVDTIKFTGTSERKQERVMMGLLRNMDTDRFYADDSEVDAAIDAAEKGKGGGA